MVEKPEPERICRLDNGRLESYDACGWSRDSYSPERFDLIGQGYIYSIDGVVQKYHGEPVRYWFFRYAKR